MKLSNGVHMPAMRSNTVCSHLSVDGTTQNGPSHLAGVIRQTKAAHTLCQTSSPRFNTKATLSESTSSDGDKTLTQHCIGFSQAPIKGGCRLNVYLGEPDKLSERDTFSLQPTPPRTFVAKVGGKRQVRATTHNR